MTRSDLLLDVARACCTYSVVIYCLVVTLVVVGAVADRPRATAAAMHLAVPATFSAMLGMAALLLAIATP